MHLLDTDTLTHLYAGHSRVIQNLRTVDDPDITITVITKIEILQGRFDFLLKAATASELLRAQALLARTEELLSQIIAIPFDEASALQFEKLRSIKKLRKVGRVDMLIASIALAQKAVLVTRNLKHSRQFPGLKVVNWVD